MEQQKQGTATKTNAKIHRNGLFFIPTGIFLTRYRTFHENSCVLNLVLRLSKLSAYIAMLKNCLKGLRERTTEIETYGHNHNLFDKLINLLLRSLASCLRSFQIPYTGIMFYL